ncbi:MAG: OsmC family protein [Desulfurococcales archaeon]|nr:OsmC family protein [Desulfurococcales archaeon]
MSGPESRLNNINIKRVREVVEEARKDPEVLKRKMSIRGTWNLDEGPQFRSKIKYEEGEAEIVVDLPKFMGGGGKAPSPLHICLTGLTSCFAGTIASIASEKGVRLKRLEVTVEAAYDFSKTFGLSDKPIIEGLEFRVDIEAENAEEPELSKIVDEASERCPAMYCLTKPIPVRVFIA